MPGRASYSEQAQAQSLSPKRAHSAPVLVQFSSCSGVRTYFKDLTEPTDSELFDLVYLSLMFEVASGELVKWVNAYETKREEREPENASAVLAASGRFLGRAYCCDPYVFPEDRAGECTSAQGHGGGTVGTSRVEAHANIC
jgi:hypothetical protein